MKKVVGIKALKDNYIWCMVSPNKSCILVDPGETQPTLQFIQDNSLSLSAILVTHHHYDHTAGIPGLLNVKQVPVYGSSKIPYVTNPISENSSLEIAEANERFMVIAVPGHTLDHVAYFQNGLVFTGDTLFTAGCGKIFEGTAHQMYDALFKIKQLPDETLVYCGHEYTENNLRFASLVEPQNKNIKERLLETQGLRKEGQPTVPAKLSLEKQTNPFLRLDVPEVIASASKYYKKPITDPVVVLKALREWKNHFS